MARLLDTILCVALAAVAGYLIGRTHLSPLSQDALAAGAGLCVVGIVLVLRAIAFFVSATRETGGVYVGLDVTRLRFAAMLAGLLLASAVLHFLLTRPAVSEEPALQMIRPALVATTAACLSSLYLVRSMWHAT